VKLGPEGPIGPQGVPGDPLEIPDGTFPRTKLDESTEAALRLAEVALTEVPDSVVQGLRDEIATVRHRLSRYAVRNDPRLRDPREPLKGTVTLDHLAPTAIGTGPGQIASSSDPRFGKAGMDPGSRWALETLKRDIELGTDRSISLAAARLAGRRPMYQAESLSPREMSTDLSIVSGELYLFPVDCLRDLNTREITYGVGKGTALSGDTLVRFGLYERQVDGSWTERAQTANVAGTAFRTTGGRQTHPYRVTSTLPRYYRISWTAYGYAWAFLVTGTLTGGFARGADLNGTASLSVFPPLVVTGQSDLPATIAAGVPAVTDKLAWGATKE
jgi:hypothetical protein